MELRGPQGARTAVASFLREQVPLHAEVARDAWGLTASQLVLPVSEPADPRTDGWFAREVETIDRWPLVGVNTGNGTTRAIDHDGDLVILRRTYPVRVYSWVRDEGFDATVDQRDNLATVILLALAVRPSLGRPDCEVVVSSLITAPSDVTPVKGDRFVAGSYVGFTLYVDETLTDRLALPGAPARDTVSAVTATSDVLPPHPALED
jgi:hypothetical protein